MEKTCQICSMSRMAGVGSGPAAPSSAVNNDLIYWYDKMRFLNFSVLISGLRSRARGMMRRNIIRSIRIFCKDLNGETHSECAVIHVPGKVICELVTVVLPVIPQVERKPGEYPETHACFGCEAGVRGTVICGDTIEWGSNKTAFEGLLVKEYQVPVEDLSEG